MSGNALRSLDFLYSEELQDNIGYPVTLAVAHGSIWMEIRTMN